MKLLFLTDNFPPESNAPASRTYEHCKEWVKEGAEVTVITCNPNFPYGKVYDGYKNKLYQSEIIDGIKVIRVWSYMAENKGALKRIADYVSYAFSAVIAGLFVKTDLIVATSPQLFTALGGCILAKIRRKPWIFELRDLWPEGIKDTGAIKNKKILDFLVKMELCLYRKSDFVITVTKGLKENLVSRGIEPSKIDIVTNGANLELFQPIEKNKKILHTLDLENKFIFGYIGTHGLAHGLEFIIQSIKEIRDERVHFLFIGTGAKKDAVVSLAEKLKLKNVTFLDPVQKNEVAEYISIIDVALIPLTKTDIHASLIPSKIFESASMLKPILLGVEGEAKDIIQRNNAGLVFEPENKKEFLDGVEKLVSDVSLYNELQHGCKRLAKEYDRKVLASKMLMILHQVQGDKMNPHFDDEKMALVEKTQMKRSEKLFIVLKSVFSLQFIKSIFTSFAYYVFEHVYWKFDINTKGVYRIHSTTSIRNAKNISLGFDTRITRNCIIWAGKTSKITIGDNVLIGPGVQLHASNHGYALDKGPMTYQERIEKDITLGNDVWIGGNSVITAGVTLADGIIVAAGSTVTKSFSEKNIIIGGVPAKKITLRN